MGTNRRYPRDPPPDARLRHCWVLGTASRRGPWPGLIVEWRRTNADGFAARVVYVDPGQDVLVEQWFALGLLLPVESEPPSRDRVGRARYDDGSAF